MFKKVFPVALAAVLALGAAGCSNNNNRGGGGGGTGMQERQGSGTTTTSQTKSNMTMGDNLSKQGKGYAEAYARMPWVHSNLVAHDWERALDDLHYVRDHVDDLLKDANLPKDAKTGLGTIKTDIAKLDASIRKHDMAAIGQSKMLVDRFAADRLRHWFPHASVMGPNSPADHWLTVQVNFDDEEQAAFIALGFGARLEVVAPASLRGRIRRELSVVVRRQGVAADV